MRRQSNRKPIKQKNTIEIVKNKKRLIIICATSHDSAVRQHTHDTRTRASSWLCRVHSWPHDAACNVDTRSDARRWTTLWLETAGGALCRGDEGCAATYAVISGAMATANVVNPHETIGMFVVKIVLLLLALASLVDSMHD